MKNNELKEVFPITALLTVIMLYTASASFLFAAYRNLSLIIILIAFSFGFFHITKSMIHKNFIFHKPGDFACSLLLLYTIFVVLTSFLRNNPNDVITIISPTMLMGYFPVFILLLHPDSINLNIIFRFCILSSIVTITYAVLNFKEIFFTSHIDMLSLPLEEMMAEQSKGDIAGFFAMPAAFMLMNFQFTKSRFSKIILWTTVFLGIGASLAYGRRGNVLILLSHILLVLYIYLTSMKIARYRKCIVIVLITSGVIYTVHKQLDNISFIEVFLERFDLDTRGDVEKEIIQNFGGGILDWILGRGIGGSYYTATWGTYRNQMETASYRMILHGGLILLIFSLAVSLKSFYLGFFKSRNNLCKIMSLYIGVNSVIIFTSSGLFEFSIRIIIFWLCVVFCNSRTWRVKTDMEIEQELLTK